jgi:hypothetical protein
VIPTRNQHAQFAEVIHELMHVLGFEPDMFGLYRTKDGTPRSERDPATGSAPIFVAPM